MSEESRSGSDTTIPAAVVEEQIEFTLIELSRACSADVEQITALIAEGVIEPTSRAGQAVDAPTGLSASRATTSTESMVAQWRFSGSSLRRARLALRLSQDLEVNAPGVALALDLMDEIEELRARLHRLGR